VFWRNVVVIQVASTVLEGHQMTVMNANKDKTSKKKKLKMDKILDGVYVIMATSNVPTALAHAAMIIVMAVLEKETTLALDVPHTSLKMNKEDVNVLITSTMILRSPRTKDSVNQPTTEIIVQLINTMMMENVNCVITTV